MLLDLSAVVQAEKVAAGIAFNIESHFTPDELKAERKKRRRASLNPYSQNFNHYSDYRRQALIEKARAKEEVRKSRQGGDQAEALKQFRVARVYDRHGFFFMKSLLQKWRGVAVAGRTARRQRTTFQIVRVVASEFANFNEEEADRGIMEGAFVQWRARAADLKRRRLQEASSPRSQAAVRRPTPDWVARLAPKQRTRPLPHPPHPHSPPSRSHLPSIRGRSPKISNNNNSSRHRRPSPSQSQSHGSVSLPRIPGERDKEDGKSRKEHEKRPGEAVATVQSHRDQDQRERSTHRQQRYRGRAEGHARGHKDRKRNQGSKRKSGKRGKSKTKLNVYRQDPRKYQEGAFESHLIKSPRRYKAHDMYMD